MMAFNNIKIKRENYAKFVGFTIDGNLTWKNHIGVIENKIFKIVGDIYRASHLLDFKHLLKIYFFFIYINYANIEWSSTFKTKLHGVLKKEKTCCTNNLSYKRFDHSKPLLKEMKALNFYQINIIQSLKIMQKTVYETNCWLFLHQFREIDHQYPTRFFQNSWHYENPACKITSSAMVFCGSTLSNSFLSQHLSFALIFETN